MENDILRIYSSHKGRRLQRTAARYRYFMNKVEVDTTRLGGGFGKREDPGNNLGRALCTGSFSPPQAGLVLPTAWKICA